MAPLYSKIELDLVSKIRQGEFKPNEPIPTEIELCAIYGVSRITVRRAVERLVAARMIYRRRGVGTFVNQPDPAAGKSLQLTGHIQDVLTFDKQLTARIFKRGFETPPKSICDAFGIEPDAKLYAISATNSLDGKPYAVTRSFFAQELSEVAPKIKMLGGKTSIQYIEKLTGIRIRSGDQTIAPASAQGVAAAELQLKPGTPILTATRLYFSDGPKPVEAVLVDYHPDRYRFRVTLLTADSLLI